MGGGTFIEILPAYGEVLLVVNSQEHGLMRLDQGLVKQAVKCVYGHGTI